VKKEQRFKTFTFHGTRKDVITAEHIVNHYEVVFTTYDTMKAGVDTCGRKECDDGDIEDVDASVKPLFQVRWHRVVLDECQLMRNEGSERAAAACKLECRSCWLLSGTPIQNKLGEARSYFKFLRYGPMALEDDVAFEPGPDGLPSSKLLSHWNAISLRRVKGT
jgi:DNA repair protein RAD16